MTAEPAGSSYLVYELERRAYPLSDHPFTIGRDAASDLVIREPAVSRSHAEVRREGDDFVLHATGATGTRLNGESVMGPAKLTDGDRIEVGTIEISFRRGRLPLGVAVIDAAEDTSHTPDPMTKRETIRRPILGGTETAPAQRKSSGISTLALVGILLAAAAYYFLMR